MLRSRVEAVAWCLTALLLFSHRAAAQNTTVPTEASPIKLENYSGYSIVSNVNQFADQEVYGTIQVPTIQFDAGANCIDYYQDASIWVGLDGFKPTAKSTGFSLNLLQAGVVAKIPCPVNLRDRVTYKAFWEYYPFNTEQKCIDPNNLELQVKPGDLVTVTIQGLSLQIYNQTTEDYCEPNVTGLGPAPVGHTVEWIVERECHNNGAKGALTTLANYGQGVPIFTDAEALYSGADANGNYYAQLTPGGYWYATANGNVAPPINAYWLQATMWEPAKFAPVGRHINVSSAAASAVTVGPNPLTFTFDDGHERVEQPDPTACK